MVQNKPTFKVDVGQIGLTDIVRSLWAGRSTVLLMMAAGFVFSIVYLNFAKFTYTAELTVIPTQAQTDGLSQRVGDLASLAGLNLNRGQNVAPFVLYSSVVRSRAVADAMSRQPEIAHSVFSRQWDAQSGTWHQPGGIVYDAVAMVKQLFGLPHYAWHPPGGDEMHTYILNNLVVTEEPKKPITTLTFSNEDPVFAAHFLQALHEATDQLLRRNTLDRASKYASYIETQLATVQQTELREVLTQNLSQQETLLMMGNSNTPFAAQPLGQAESTSRPTSPRPLRVLLLGIVLGGLLGAGASIYRIPVLEWTLQRLRRGKSSLAAVFKGKARQA